MENTAYRALAIVGVGAILPDAPTAPAFWENVKKGRYSITNVAPERWDPALYYDPDPAAPDKTYSKIGGWVREFEWNPNQWKLAIPPRVAEAMDEGQKWAVACTREALADYGYPARPIDLNRTAVILGNAMGGEHHYLSSLRIYFPEYARELAETPDFAALPEAVRRQITRELHQRIEKLLPEVTEDTMPGELSNCIAGRIANLFNFRGPNFTTDAACASAMAAFHSAIEGLVENEFDLVVTGGIDRNMGASTFVKFCKIHALSATGTRPYAEGADGFVMGEGAAVFLMKRLADAERDGDKVYAVVRGLGGSSDGKGKGITAPNPIGQRLCIERAWESAGLSPATATLIEGHGTSTSVGDVVEAQSVVDVLNQFHLPVDSVALGSVKSNLGHLKGAAGAAAILKTTFALRDRVLPPSLHCEHPNPSIDFAHSPLYVNTDLRPWTATAEGVRRAGVSAFGFGGTNFHVVLEEYIPHRLNGNGHGKGSVTASETQNPARSAGSIGQQQAAAVAAVSNRRALEINSDGRRPPLHLPRSSSARYCLEGNSDGRRPPLQQGGRDGHPAKCKAPLRGALVIGAASNAELSEKLRTIQNAAEDGRAPAIAAPAESVLRSAQRLVIDYADARDLADKAGKAQKALAANQPAIWKALRAQGIYRGHGPAPKVAFLYTGQGSQYANMLREIRAAEPIVADTFAEADRVMMPLLGKPLTDFVFVNPADAEAITKAEEDLRQTEITQPAVMAIDAALTRLLAAYGIEPGMAMGHSLGEYGALVAAGALPFNEALEAVSARGRGMTEVAVEDKGKMAAIFAPLAEIEKVLNSVDGNVVVANVNSRSQAVIGGGSKFVDRAVEAFLKAGFNAVPLPVSHAFHTSIVAPASEPLRRVLEHLHLQPPRIPVVANLSGEFYPSGQGVVPRMVDILARQVASPVQFVKGLETLYQAGARVFVEVGPKKALQGFAEDVLGDRGDVVSIFTNHPKIGDIVAFNQALCALYAAGLGRGAAESGEEAETRAASVPCSALAAGATAAEFATPAATMASVTPGSAGAVHEPPLHSNVGSGRPQDSGNDAVLRGDQAVGRCSVTITGAALGLPGTEHIFDDANVARILHGEQFIDVIPSRFRRAILDKHITRLVKTDNGGPVFAPIDSVKDVIKLAGRGGAFDLQKEFGVSAERLGALDRATRLAMGAGLDALRDAGIPLVLHYKNTTRSTQLPDGWKLPEAMRDDTGIIFASIFPGYDSFAQDITHYHLDRSRREKLAMLEGLRGQVSANNGDSVLAQGIDRQMDELRAEISSDPFLFDRRFVFRLLAMGHSQFAEFIGCRGPNTQINAACATTTQAVAVAEDWIRTGRCRRVIIIAADDPTTDTLLPWMGSGFLATGAAATDEVVEDAAIPFDRRRHGMIMGMGAAAMVMESAEAARERGIRPICEVLSAVTANSAFHGTRLDVRHICQVMEELVAEAERRSGVSRREMAGRMVFVSHETYTPARGGSAAAEINALRHVFGDLADQIVITNTKGFTGHAMGVGIEDVVAVKALETGCVPPVANFKEVDPELGPLNLSKGGAYPVTYALRLGAGFGSQISMTLLRWSGSEAATRPSPRSLGFAYRIADPQAWQAWLGRMAGHATPDMEVVHRTLRVKDHGAAVRASAAPAAVEAPRPVAAGTASAPQAAAQNVRPAASQPQVAAGNARQAASVDQQAVQPQAAVQYAPPGVAVPPAQQHGRDGHPKTGTETRPPSTNQSSLPAPLSNDLQLPSPPWGRGVGGEGDTRAAAPAAATADPVKEKVLALVAEKTGYPSDMLDLDLDLEADLGVDTVKQAEVFASVREAYGIARDDKLKLRDFPTLKHVIQFVHDRRPDLTVSPPVPATTTCTTPVGPGFSPDLAGREAGPAPTPSGLTAPTTPTPPGPKAGPTADPVNERVLALVVEKTGYPSDMLDLELDLEADLGVDTVKQAEMFAAIRSAYDIPREENVKLRDFPTLKHVIQFVYDHRPDLRQPAASEVPAAAIQSPLPAPPSNEVQLPSPPWGRGVGGEGDTTAATAAAQAAPVADAAAKPATAPAPQIASLDAANSIPRRVPVPILRPPLELCKPTAVKLGPGQRVLMMPDQGGVAEALSKLLQSMDVEVVTLPSDPDAIEEELKNVLARGAVHGVYWLAALDDEGSISEMNLAAWRQALRRRVKSLYTTMREVFHQIAPAGTFLVAATRMGGQHGYGDAGAVSPMGGAVAGFVKTYKRERMDALVKVVDFEPGRDAAEVAECLLKETTGDPGSVEIGYKDGLRWSVGLREEPAADGQPGIMLDKNTVFLVTGAAGSIVSAIIADLAAASAGTFYLLDLVPEPEADNPDMKRFVDDKDGLKRDLLARLQQRGERATPALVEKELAAIERLVAVRNAIDAVWAAGGTANYFSVNLTDANAVAKVINRVREEHGRIDVLLHAAGMERSHVLPDKDAREFDLVFDVKADGWFNLFDAIGDMPVGASVAFSSVAGRFGNRGQADYSAANDLLCEIASNFRRTRPATRAIAIDWTAWSGIGMAARGFIPKMMELAGIDMLPPEAGIPLIRRELTVGGTRGEVVIAERLGILASEWDATGGLAPQSIEDKSAVRPEAGEKAGTESDTMSFGPMMGRVTGMSLQHGLTVETTLDPKIQPFLYDHQIDGTPVLPGVMGIEAFAEAALWMLPKWRIEAIEKVDFLASFKFYRHEPRTLTVQSVFYPNGEDLLAECRLIGSRVLPNHADPQITTHFTARVRLAKVDEGSASGVAEAERTAAAPGQPSGVITEAAEIYRLYFHGPAYQVLERTWRQADRIVGLMANNLPAHHHPSELHTAFAPRIVELCFQTAGLWEMSVQGRMGLPQHLDEVRFLLADGSGAAAAQQVPDDGRATTGSEARLYAVVTPKSDGRFDAEVVDSRGNLYLRLRGYRTVALPASLEADALKARAAA